MSSDYVFADRIKKLREEKGISLSQAADEMGIGHSSLSQYENAKRKPNLDVVKLFATYYRTTCDYLIGMDNVMPIKKIAN